MENKLPTISALWIGDVLGIISKACLTSFVMRGHDVHLYTYNKLKDVPKSVEIRDANSIIPSSQIVKHKKTGSYALFSDIFRYQLLQKVGGIYVDCDVYCLKPLTFSKDGYLFGFEADNRLNGAVLALPAHSDLLNQLIQISSDESFIPPWYSKSRQIKLAIKKKIGLVKTVAEMPWGVIGPDAISYFAKQMGVMHYAQPIDVFYPVHYQCVGQFLDVELDIADIVSKRTACIHLYNEMLRDVNLQELKEDNILYHLLNNDI